MIDIGEKMEGIPLVTKGLLKVYKEDENDHEIFLYYLKPGDICAMGIKCCITEGKSLARVYCEEDAEVLFVSKEAMGELQDNPSWNNFLIQSLTNRVENLLDVADDLAFKKLDERVLEYLKRKGEIENQNPINITHKAISIDLNSSREVISRVMKKLEQEGRIKQQRNAVELR